MFTFPYMINNTRPVDENWFSIEIKNRLIKFISIVCHEILFGFQIFGISPFVEKNGSCLPNMNVLLHQSETSFFNSRYLEYKWEITY